jgi:hypothetical protein
MRDKLDSTRYRDRAKLKRPLNAMWIGSVLSVCLSVSEAYGPS